MVAVVEDNADSVDGQESESVSFAEKVTALIMFGIAVLVLGGSWIIVTLVQLFGIV